MKSKSDVIWKAGERSGNEQEVIYRKNSADSVVYFTCYHSLVSGLVLFRKVINVL